MPTRIHASLSLGPLLAAGCYAFPDPRLGECGNRIVESDEDCDNPDDPRICAVVNELLDRSDRLAATDDRRRA